MSRSTDAFGTELVLKDDPFYRVRRVDGRYCHAHNKDIGLLFHRRLKLGHLRNVLGFAPLVRALHEWHVLPASGACSHPVLILVSSPARTAVGHMLAIP